MPNSECFTKIDNLTAAEAFWLWAIHYWIESRSRQIDPVPLFSKAFVEMSIVSGIQEDKALQFDYSLSLLVDFSTKPLRIRCSCNCGLLGNMEQIVLGCMALQQNDQESKNVAGIILQNILPDLLVSTVFKIFMDLSESSLANGMVLPVRPSYLDLAQNFHSAKI